MKLPATVLAYNIATNRVTGTSPFEAVFGRKPRLPVDFVFPFEETPRQTLAKFVQVQQSQLSKAVQHMIESEARVIQLDPRYRPKETFNPIQEGQIVYMFVTRLQPKVSAKLQTPWIGPFKVLRTPTQSLAEVEAIGTWCTNPRVIPVTVDRLVVVDETTIPVSELHPNSPMDLEEDELVGDGDEDEIVVDSPMVGDPLLIDGPTSYPVPDPADRIKDEIMDDEDLEGGPMPGPVMMEDIGNEINITPPLPPPTPGELSPSTSPPTFQEVEGTDQEPWWDPYGTDIGGSSPMRSPPTSPASPVQRDYATPYKFLNQGLAAGRPPTLQPEPVRGKRVLFRTEVAPYSKKKGGILSRLTKTVQPSVIPDDQEPIEVRGTGPGPVIRQDPVQGPRTIPSETGAKPKRGPPPRGLPSRWSAEPARSVRVTRQSQMSSAGSTPYPKPTGTILRRSKRVESKKK